MISAKKQLLFQKQAEIAKAIAHPLRIAIVDFLKDGEQCVCDIAERVGSERSNVSRHLSVMVNAGVLEYRKEGAQSHLQTQDTLHARIFFVRYQCFEAAGQRERKAAQELIVSGVFDELENRVEKISCHYRGIPRLFLPASRIWSFQQCGH